MPNLSVWESDCAREIPGNARIIANRDSNTTNVFRDLETPFGIGIARHARCATRLQRELRYRRENGASGASPGIASRAVAQALLPLGVSRTEFSHGQEFLLG